MEQREVLLNKKENLMSDFEKLLWIRKENKELIKQINLLKKQNNALKNIASSKVILDKNKELLEINKSLNQTIQYWKENKSISLQGLEVVFNYNGQQCISKIKFIRKNFITVYSFNENGIDGYRVRYKDIIKITSLK